MPKSVIRSPTRLKRTESWAPRLSTSICHTLNTQLLCITLLPPGKRRRIWRVMMAFDTVSALKKRRACALVHIAQARRFFSAETVSNAIITRQIRRRFPGGNNVIHSNCVFSVWQIDVDNLGAQLSVRFNRVGDRMTDFGIQSVA